MKVDGLFSCILSMYYSKTGSILWWLIWWIEVDFYINFYVLKRWFVNGLTLSKYLVAGGRRRHVDAGRLHLTYSTQHKSFNHGRLHLTCSTQHKWFNKWEASFDLQYTTQIIYPWEASFGYNTQHKSFTHGRLHLATIHNTNHLTSRRLYLAYNTQHKTFNKWEALFGLQYTTQTI